MSVDSHNDFPEPPVGYPGAQPKASPQEAEKEGTQTPATQKDQQLNTEGAEQQHLKDQMPAAPRSGFPQNAKGPQRQHVHHSYIWLGSLRVAISIFVVVFITTFGILMSEGINIARGLGASSSLMVGLIVIVVFVVIMGIVALFEWLSYKHLSYEVGPEEFSLYSGIFNKKRVHIPYQRIQSVNQRASVFQRIFGVCMINIDTAGGSSNKSVLIPYVQNFEAERLRKELFARKQWALDGEDPESFTAAQSAQKSNVLDAPAEFASDVRGVFGAPRVDTGAVSYEYGMNNRELLFTGLSNSTGFVLLALIVISTIVGIAGQLLETAFGRALAEVGVNWLARSTSSGLVWFIVGAVVFAFGIVWVISVIGTCISYGGFKARRRQSRIEVEHGLLQHQFHGVDINRVQSVVIKQGFIRRLFGYCELSLGKIDAVTTDSSEQNTGAPAKGLVIHPFVKFDKIPEILAGLVPEFSEVPTEQIKLPKVALRRGIIRRCVWHGSGFWLAICCIPLQVLINFAYESTFALSEASSILLIAPELVVANSVFIVIYVLCVVLFVFEAINTVLWFNGSSFAYNHKFMQITNGGFSRESVSFPRQKIQYGTIRTNPFQRMSQVATVQARTAAGVGGTTLRLLDVQAKDAESWLMWLLPHKM